MLWLVRLVLGLWDVLLSRARREIRGGGRVKREIRDGERGRFEESRRIMGMVCTLLEETM